MVGIIVMLGGNRNHRVTGKRDGTEGEERREEGRNTEGTEGERKRARRERREKEGNTEGTEGEERGIETRKETEKCGHAWLMVSRVATVAARGLRSAAARGWRWLAAFAPRFGPSA